MDLASTFTGLIGTTYKTIKFIQDTLDNLKNAPSELQLLRDRVEDIESSLAELEHQEVAGLFHSEQDINRLNRLADRAGKCLSEIEAFMNDMLKSRKDGEKRVDKVMWLWRGKDIEKLKGHLVQLEGALQSTWNLVHSRFQVQQVELQRATQSTLITISSTVQATDMRIDAMRVRHGFTTSAFRESSAQSTQHHATRRLRCLEDCRCRCHAASSRGLLPRTVSMYIGQVRASKKLLDDMHIARLECDVQTCRRDRKAPVAVTWYAPTWMPCFGWQVPLGRIPIHFSIRTPRLVPFNAPIWDAIRDGNVDELRRLLVAGEASVDDVDKFGATVLEFACYTWLRFPSQNSYEAVRFLVEAGADPELAVGKKLSTKHILALYSLSTLIEYPNATFAHQVTTSSVAIDICQSIFGMDITEAAEDYLEFQRVPSEYAAALGLWQDSISDVTSTSLNIHTLFRIVDNWAPLEYAALYSPDLVERLLERGEDATIGAPLDHAAYSSHTDLIRPLLDASADVNAANFGGMIALHSACGVGALEFLRTLIHYVEAEIDWGIRTPEGKTALQLAEESFRRDGWPHLRPSEREEFFNILRTYIPDEAEDGDEPLNIPGAFT